MLGAQVKASPQLQGPELLCEQDSQGAQRTLLQNLGSDTLVHSQTHKYTQKPTFIHTPKETQTYTHIFTYSYRHTLK